jgi:UDP-N-acetylglucosamine--N-acetylmuramyl-(pentapeptide) pyrophosphoryl-undecaprenol N-acetylglucosamine transferase
MKKKCILITGGHLTPALAVIEALQQYHDIDIVFVGRTIALEKQHTMSEEERLVQQKNIQFYPLTTGRLTRTFSIDTFISLCKIPQGFIESFQRIKDSKPDLIVTFGGYIGFPISIVATILGIPIVLHEQSVVPGLSNRIIGRIAKKIFVTYKETSSYFKKSTDVVGLPIRSNILKPPSQPSFRYPKEYPILYIAGGSTGSVSLNTFIFSILSELLSTYTIIHQTGHVSYPQSLTYKTSLQPKLSDRYIPLPYIEETDLAWVYKHASLYIGRSGANTVMELLLTGLCAICIPLPWASHKEQEYNAKKMESLGRSIILPQDSLTKEKIFQNIDTLLLKSHQSQSNQSIDFIELSRVSSQIIATSIHEIVK